MRKRKGIWLMALVAPGLLAALAADAPTAPPPGSKPAETPATPAAAALPKPENATYEKDIHAFTEKYCYECHGDGMHKANVALDKYQTLADVQKDAKTWELVLEKVHLHEMPPDDADAQPTEQERDLLIDWIDRAVHQYDPANPDPGRNTLHRLNRAEYANSIRDLTGVNYNAGDDFPPDDSGYGFDNIGDVLSLPPMLMEKYLSAADTVLDRAIPTDPIVPRKQTFPAYLLASGFNDLGPQAGGWVHLISLEEGHVTLDQFIPAPGEYKISFEAYGDRTGGYSTAGVGYRDPSVPTDPEVPQMSLRLGETIFGQFTIDADSKDQPAEYSAEISLPAGPQEVHAVMQRVRGGDNENVIINGRVGRQQHGVAWVRSMTIEGPLPGAIMHYRADQLTASGSGNDTAAGERFINGAGGVSVKFTVPKAGDYILRATAYAQQAGDEPTKMDFRMDGQSLHTFDVLAHAGRLQLPGERVFSNHPAALTLQHGVPQVYEFRAHLTPGAKTFSAELRNPFADPQNENPNLRERTLTIQSLEIVDLSQPFAQPQMSEAMKPYFSQPVTPENKTARARDILTRFAQRAWRGPVDPAEIDRLMKLFALADHNGETFEVSVKLAMKGVLVSPHFLFREAAPDNRALADTAARPVKIPVRASAAGAPPPAPATASLGVPVDEYTLASRLSYFLWSSTPDDELLDLAGKGQLRAHLDEQVKRMLASPKAQALVDNFAGQWLQFRSLATFSPDAKVLQNYYNAWPELCAEMEQETGLFFDYIMREDRSVMDFLTADYTFVNEDLANYYGLPGVVGENFRKVSLAGTPRRGVLTQGSTLILTSNPTRTSPVKRGKWVLDNLLGTPPPPPPPNVPVLDEETQLTGTLRQQMEQHRANPTCASCHARMDPLGFGLENFDAAGEWRDNDGQAPIDASGVLLTGESFKSATELVQILANKKRADFLRCISEKMLTYGLGRGLEYYDRATTDQMVKQLEANGDKFSALILGVVHSVPFQEMRRTEAAPAPPADAAKVANN